MSWYDTDVECAEVALAKALRRRITADVRIDYPEAVSIHVIDTRSIGFTVVSRIVGPRGCILWDENRSGEPYLVDRIRRDIQSYVRIVRTGFKGTHFNPPKLRTLTNAPVGSMKYSIPLLPKAKISNEQEEAQDATPKVNQAPDANHWRGLQGRAPGHP